MLVLWCVGVVALAVGMFFLARWVDRRADELPDTPSTLTDEEHAQAQLGIALSAGNTFTSTH